MASANQKKGLWQKTRKFFNDIHLWVGLISGLVILVVCLTGTIYVYNSEIREMGQPHLYKFEVPKDGEKLSPDQVVDLVRTKTDAPITGISIENAAHRPYQVNTKPEGGNSRFGLTYYVNPYNGEILGKSDEPNSVAEFMGYMFSLHRWLLLDKIEEPLIGELPNRTLGSYISGACTILFTIGVITGMVIWFPQRIKNWRQGLKVKFGKSWKRTNHDLHNTLAFYSIIILFLMGATGPFWSFPWYREALQKSLGTYQERPAQGAERGPGREGPGRRGGEEGNAEKEAQKIGVEPVHSIMDYISVADFHLQYEGNYRVNLPQKPGDPVNIQKGRTGFFAPAAGDRIVLNAASLDVIEKDIFREKPINERISRSIKALHVGDVYGQFSKLLYFIACLIATSLPITGTLIWINKMKKKKPSPRRKVQPTDAKIHSAALS
ncbi:PepSY-associated TM helix domain-containing protein [Belliella marina]|uniref:PepSY-associated TM helix domain-containing protein n=1 Tax=Belliella marina TaxID=1644146 RepID=A0ABW4VMF3_9BACT